MGIFLNVLQGAYAYILIFQILVVSALFLMLCYLIVKRTREAVEHGTTNAQLNQSIGSAAMAASAAAEEGEAGDIGRSLANRSSAFADPDPELLNRVSELERENADGKKALNDNKNLLEKVKFLESKLLEYEILQEEIGALSALKHENEQLKRRLIESGQGPGSEVATAASTPETSTITPKMIQVVPETAPVAQEPTLPAQTAAKTEPSKAEPVEMEAAGPTEASVENLEKLLSKIDELTQEGGGLGPEPKSSGGKSLSS